MYWQEVRPGTAGHPDGSPAVLLEVLPYWSCRIDIMIMRITAFFVLLFGCTLLSAQKIVPYAERDTGAVNMAIYYPEKPLEGNPCVVYLFGGGFIGGSYLDSMSVVYCRKMADAGFIAVAPDYRLGLKGAKTLTAPSFYDEQYGGNAQYSRIFCHMYTSSLISPYYENFPQAVHRL